jgi:hypothetical protein
MYIRYNALSNSSQLNNSAFTLSHNMRAVCVLVSVHVETAVHVSILAHVQATAHVSISQVHIISQVHTTSHVFISLHVLVCVLLGEETETVKDDPELEFQDQKYSSAFSNVI